MTPANPANRKRRLPGALRDDEQFVISAIAREFSASWEPGEDPPDAYLLLGEKRIAVEISRLMQPIIDGRGTRSRITDDKATIAVGDELNLKLRTMVPEGYRVSLVMRSPILELSKTKNRIFALLKSSLQDFQSFPRKRHVQFHDNPIAIYLDEQVDPLAQKITIGFIGSAADLGVNTRHILKDRIETKAAKCGHLSERGPLWLALFNNYWLTDADTYRFALSMLSVQHPFAKILIVSDQGAVDTIT